MQYPINPKKIHRSKPEKTLRVVAIAATLFNSAALVWMLLHWRH